MAYIDSLTLLGEQAKTLADRWRALVSAIDDGDIMQVSLALEEARQAHAEASTTKLLDRISRQVQDAVRQRAMELESVMAARPLDVESLTDAVESARKVGMKKDTLAPAEELLEAFSRLESWDSIEEQRKAVALCKSAGLDSQNQPKMREAEIALQVEEKLSEARQKLAAALASFAGRAESLPRLALAIQAAESAGLSDDDLEKARRAYEVADQEKRQPFSAFKPPPDATATRSGTKEAAEKPNANRTRGITGARGSVGSSTSRDAVAAKRRTEPASTDGDANRKRQRLAGAAKAEEGAMHELCSWECPSNIFNGEPTLILNIDKLPEAFVKHGVHFGQKVREDWTKKVAEDEGSWIDSATATTEMPADTLCFELAVGEGCVRAGVRGGKKKQRVQAVGAALAIAAAAVADDGDERLCTWKKVLQEGPDRVTLEALVAYARDEFERSFNNSSAYN